MREQCGNDDLLLVGKVTVEQAGEFGEIGGVALARGRPGGRVGGEGTGAAQSPL